MKTLTKIVASALLFTACVPAMADNMVCNHHFYVTANLLDRGYVKTVEMNMNVLDNDGRFVSGKGQFWLSSEGETIIAFLHGDQSCLVALITEPVTMGI